MERKENFVENVSIKTLRFNGSFIGESTNGSFTGKFIGTFIDGKLDGSFIGEKIHNSSVMLWHLSKIKILNQKKTCTVLYITNQIQSIDLN